MAEFGRESGGFQVSYDFPKRICLSVVVTETEHKVDKTEADPRSTVRFFRTHLGSVGNLLTKILESRNPKSGPVTFQGDLSTTNLPSPELQKKFSMTLAGCGSHTRRPFWRFRADDEDLCYFMARGFAVLGSGWP